MILLACGGEGTVSLRSEDSERAHWFCAPPIDDKKSSANRRRDFKRLMFIMLSLQLKFTAFDEESQTLSLSRMTSSSFCQLFNL